MAKKSEEEKVMEAIMDNDPDRLSACHFARYDITLPTKIKNWKKVTPIMLAAYYGSTECILKLLHNGVNLYHQSASYRQALILSAEGGHADCIHVLCRHALFLTNFSETGELSTAVDTLDYKTIQNMIESGNKDGIGMTTLIEDVNVIRNATNFLILCGCSSEYLNHLLHSKDEIDLRDRHGFTPLISAVIAGNEHCVQWLLENGANVNVLDKVKLADHQYARDMHLLADNKGDIVLGENKSPLMFACMLNRVKCVALLLSHGADVNLKDVGGFSALMHAANSKNYECVEKIISFSLGKGLNINAANTSFRTALILAAYSGDDKSVGIILAAKASHCLKDKLNRTAFMASVFSGNLKCVNLLYNVQDDIYLEDSELEMTLMTAARFKNVEILKFLLEKTTMPLHLKKENAKSILKEPLFCAVVRNNLESVELILKHGADVNSRGVRGTTPLMIACKNKNIDLFYFLVENGANIHIFDDEDDNNNSVLMFAISLDFECVNCLVEKGVDVNAQNKQSKTPLMKACLLKRPDCVKLLLENGAMAKIDAKDIYHMTALMYTVKGDCVESCKILLEAGANIEIECQRLTVFWLAVERAIRYKHTDHLKALIEAGSVFDTDGSVKKIHTNEVYRFEYMSIDYAISRWEMPLLLTLFEIGVINWNWLLTSCVERFIVAVLVCGISPGTFVIKHKTHAYTRNMAIFNTLKSYNLDPQLSPLKFATLKFKNFNLQLTKYLLANLYLTQEDYKFLVLDKVIQKVKGVDKPNNELVKYCNQISKSPWKLEVLCFLSISTLITDKTEGKSHLPNIRNKIVDSLPLPDVFKRKLKFKGHLSALCPSAWRFIGKPHGQKESQNIISLTTPIWPYPHFLVPCQQPSCPCGGVCNVVKEVSNM